MTKKRLLTASLFESFYVWNTTDFTMMLTPPSRKRTMAAFWSFPYSSRGPSRAASAMASTAAGTETRANSSTGPVNSPVTR